MLRKVIVKIPGGYLMFWRKSSEGFTDQDLAWFRHPIKES